MEITKELAGDWKKSDELVRYAKVKLLIHDDKQLKKW